jgi:hypothetical protein
MKNELASALKGVKRLRKKLCFTAGVLKEALVEWRLEKV